MTCEPLVRFPTLPEVAVIGALALTLSLMETALFFMLRRRRAKDHVERVAWHVGFQFALIFIRSDARVVALGVFIMWLIWRDTLKRLWKALGSKSSALTEVARAAFQRQQKEMLG